MWQLVRKEIPYRQTWYIMFKSPKTCFVRPHDLELCPLTTKIISVHYCFQVNICTNLETIQPTEFLSYYVHKAKKSIFEVTMTLTFDLGPTKPNQTFLRNHIHKNGSYRRKDFSKMHVVCWTLDVTTGWSRGVVIVKGWMINGGGHLRSRRRVMKTLTLLLWTIFPVKGGCSS